MVQLRLGQARELLPVRLLLPVVAASGGHHDPEGAFDRRLRLLRGRGCHGRSGLVRCPMLQPAVAGHQLLDARQSAKLSEAAISATNAVQQLVKGFFIEGLACCSHPRVPVTGVTQSNKFR